MNSEQLLSQEFIRTHTIEAARELEKLPIDEIVLFFNEIPVDQSAILVEYFTPILAAKCLEKVDSPKVMSIILKLSLETGSILLRQMDEFKRTTTLQMMPKEVTESFGLVLKYPDNSAGALMNPQVFTLYKDVTVKEALKQIRKYPKYVSDYIPVLNREHILEGIINIHELIQKKPELTITSVMNSGIGKLSPILKREAILSHPDWLIFHELPVVDKNGIFLGMLSYKVLRRLEYESKESEQPEYFESTGKALGELYWLGITAFIKGAASIIQSENKKA